MADECDRRKYECAVEVPLEVAIDLDLPQLVLGQPIALRKALSTLDSSNFHVLVESLLREQQVTVVEDRSTSMHELQVNRLEMKLQIGRR
jgi:hypothetical protein